MVLIKNVLKVSLESNAGNGSGINSMRHTFKNVNIKSDNSLELKLTVNIC